MTVSVQSSGDMVPGCQPLSDTVLFCWDVINDSTNCLIIHIHLTYQLIVGLKSQAADNAVVTVTFYYTERTPFLRQKQRKFCVEIVLGQIN